MPQKMEFFFVSLFGVGVGRGACTGNFGITPYLFPFPFGFSDESVVTRLPVAPPCLPACCFALRHRWEKGKKSGQPSSRVEAKMGFKHATYYDFFFPCTGVISFSLAKVIYGKSK